MIETVTITRISATDKKADGTKLVNKYGEFFRIGIQVEERLDSNGDPVWINGFSKERPTWQIGDKIEVEIAEKEYNGTISLQFRLPKGSSELEGRVKKLEDKVFNGEETKETDEQPDIDKF